MGDLTYGPWGERTEGHSGTDTSQERAETQARDGTASARQRAILRFLYLMRAQGLTIAELRDYQPDVHHGALSGALTNMHRAGRVARLSEKRGRCKVYVLPEYVNGRETEEPLNSHPSDEALELMRDLWRYFNRNDGKVPAAKRYRDEIVKVMQKWK